jgi:tetratricopeptide (TPR) repeat protein
MVTKSWYDAYDKRHHPLMVEIARSNMQRYWDKVTDAQSKASLLHMLGYSLIRTLEEEVRKEGKKYIIEAMKLLRSLGERSVEDIVYGVWPERCVICWDTYFQQLDPSERNGEMERMLEMVNLTRRTINSELTRGAGSPDLLRLQGFSQSHYTAELQAIYYLSVGFDLRSLNEAERWLAIFEKRVEEIEIAVGREGWDLDPVRRAKLNLIQQNCKLYYRQGKAEFALELLREAMEKKKDPDALLDRLYAELSLKTGGIEEAFDSMAKFFSVRRSIKAVSVNAFRYFLQFVPEESKPLFEELIPQYPHVLWTASSAGFVELSKEENKALRSKLEKKKKMYCVNCSEELSKIYRCSRCDVATYCGSACQKEAWKEHKKICKREENGGKSLFNSYSKREEMERKSLFHSFYQNHCQNYSLIFGALFLICFAAWAM